MHTNVLRNKKNSKILNSVEKILINNLQKKYYLRVKHQKLLDNILNTFPNIIKHNPIYTLSTDILIIPERVSGQGTLNAERVSGQGTLNAERVSGQGIQKTVKTININCIIQRETTIEYCINEFLYLLFSN